MLDKNIQDKISFSGVILSVQPRSNVWRYRLDNRTHSMTGYNIFLKGTAEGEEKEFAVAISEKQQQKFRFHIGNTVRYQKSGVCSLRGFWGHHLFLTQRMKKQEVNLIQALGMR